MTTSAPVRPRRGVVFRLGLALIGLALSVGAGAVGLLAAILALFECHGSDVSTRPASGSLQAELCGWPADVAFYGLVPLAVLAPLLGGTLAALEDDGRPLGFAIAVSSGAFTALGLLALPFSADAILLGPAAFVCAVSLLALKATWTRS